MDVSAERLADDCWSRWLNNGRDGGDAAMRARVEADTAAFAARVLGFVPKPPGEMLDIGSGGGLMGWAALARWPDVFVTMTDISPALLAQARAEAARLGVAARCQFMRAGAETLGGIADASQDLVTSRSALAYVADKPAAFRAAYRVLRPGGMIAIAEPLFRDEALSACLLRQAAAETGDPLLALLRKWKAAQFPSTHDAMEASPLANYTERELLGFAKQAGFRGAHLELHIDERAVPPRGWEAFCAASPHPLAPCLADILARDFSHAEREMFEAAIRPGIEAGQFGTASRMVYLYAYKP